MQNSDEWEQNYQDSISSLPEFDEMFDATDFAPGPTGDNMSNPKVSSSSSPKSSIGKRIRRRSRASKKAPTTLLTADTNNFRALVQQFTGCHSAPAAFGSYKGPINLNFEHCNYYCGKPETHRHHQQQQQVDGNLHEQSDQSFFSFGVDNIAAVTTAAATTSTTDNHGLFVSSGNNNPRPDPLTLDDFDIETFSIPELSGHGTRNDDFWG